MLNVGWRVCALPTLHSDRLGAPWPEVFRDSGNAALGYGLAQHHPASGFLKS